MTVLELRTLESVGAPEVMVTTEDELASVPSDEAPNEVVEADSAIVDDKLADGLLDDAFDDVSTLEVVAEIAEDDTVREQDTS